MPSSVTSVSSAASAESNLSSGGIKKTDAINIHLQGSIKIPKSKWGSLPDNSEICYFRNDGKFVKKCFIKTFYEKNGDKYVICSNKLNRAQGDKYYSEYRLKLSNIKEIYKRVSQDSIIEYKLIKVRLDKEIEGLKEIINNLETRLSKEEESSKRIVKLIKHLHNIKSLDELKKII
jgi:hypothetical protein